MGLLFSGKKNQSLRQHSNRVGIWQEEPRLTYMIPWVYIDPTNGIVHNNDHSMMAIYKFRGPDMASATEQELVFFNADINNAIRRLPTGYTLYFEAQRLPSHKYEKSEMPTPILQAMEDLREEYFTSGNFYDSEYYFIIYAEPPQKIKQKLTAAFIEDKKNKGENREEDLSLFIEETDKFLTNVNQLGLMLKGSFKEVEALTDPDVITTFLHTLVSDKRHPVKCNPMRWLNTYVCDASLTGGRKPMLGKKHMRILTVLDFPPVSTPGLFDIFNQLNISYRWTSRFMCLSDEDARRELKQSQKNWANQSISLWTRVQRAITKQQSETDVDPAMIENSNDSAEALSELGTGAVAYGYYTMTMTLFADTEKDADNAASHVLSMINRLGFTGYIETDNAIEAWRGSLPGCPRCNIRRPLVSSLNFCHLAPVTAMWSGDKRNKHLKGPVLLYSDSYNSEFRLSLHVGALAHTLITGPSGSGKSVLLNTLEAHFMKYPGSRVFIFDKAASSRIVTYAAGGNFYNIASNDASDLSFQPLANIDKKDERIWANGWLAGFLERGKMEVTEEHRARIDKALISLSQFPPEQRTLTNFVNVVQDTDIRVGLRALTKQGPYGQLFDNSVNITGTGRWQVYEMEAVMRTPAIVPSTIDFLFHQIDSTLKEDTPYPTMIILDECWLFFDNPVFRDKIREYFKDLRKKNASILVATQNLADIASKPDLLATVLENCPNRIYLRNPNAVTDQVRNYYRTFNCNERQIDIIATLDNQERHEYYYSCLEKGNRVFDLALNPIEAAFVLSTDKSDQIQANKIIEAGEFDNFVYHWFMFKGLHAEWNWFKERYLSPTTDGEEPPIEEEPLPDAPDYTDTVTPHEQEQETK